MTDETKSGLDAVSEGPVASDTARAPASGAVAEAGSHATVAAMTEKFSGAVVRHEIQAGDQHVVFVDAAGRLHERFVLGEKGNPDVKTYKARAWKPKREKSMSAPAPTSSMRTRLCRCAMSTSSSSVTSEVKPTSL